MDLGYGAERERYRDEVTAFLAANWVYDKSRSKDEQAEAEKSFRRMATDRGYLYRSVPRRYGGSEQEPDILKAQIIQEEFRKVRAPGEVLGIGTQMLVPTLLECGEEWQREMFVRKTIEGEYRWCQGYSEPGSGSDLASLRTGGELIGDEWVINGQKVWTSYAHDAHYMFALVRTEPDAPKHAGLSYLLLDVRQPGLTIRPLKQITGGAEFNEVFFDNVKTPAHWIVGKRGEGWKTSRSLLKHERNMLGSIDRADELFTSLLGLARRAERDGQPAIKDACVRDRLVTLLGYLEVQRHSSRIQLTRAVRGEDAGILPMTNKLAQSNFSQSIAALAIDLIREDGLLAPGGPDQGNERWMNHFMASLAAAIAGGTSNIQRNIIAERGLGLPRESATTGDRK